MNLRNALLTATIVAAPLTAFAQPVTGLYVSGGAGINMMMNERMTATGPGISSTGRASTSIGPAVVLGLGWGFGNGVRAEVEGDFRSDKMNGNTLFPGGSFGRENKYGMMANALYDFNVSPFVTPYLGAGIGFQAVHESGSNFVSSGSNVTLNGGTKLSFAYQGIAGVAFPIPQHPVWRSRRSTASWVLPAIAIIAGSQPPFRVAFRSASPKPPRVITTTAS
jgi:opacity protein-like surface antigen